MAQKHIRFDWAIKKLLRNKANFEILEGFFSELLMEDIFVKKFWKVNLTKRTKRINLTE